MPITKTAIVATSNAGVPPCSKSIQAIGKATTEPIVPGAFGDKPAPKTVAIILANRRVRWLTFEFLGAQGGQDGKVGEILLLAGNMSPCMHSNQAKTFI